MTTALAVGRVPDELPRSTDVLVIGAGIVGTAVAAFLAVAGVEVCVVDRAAPADGASSSGEGNLLVSDKLPGPELDLALRSIELWRRRGALVGDAIELEPKGGVVLARTAAERHELWTLARAQAAGGARVQLLESDELREVEPFVAFGLAGGVFYEQDCQVQPMLAVASRVAELRSLGVRLVWPAEVTGALHDADGRIVAAETDRGRVSIGTCVVNAGGPWSGTVAARLGAIIPVVPRRGHVLVTEPVAPVTLHKVAEAGYVGSVHAGGDGRSCSAVVESTRSGTMLLGSSREFAGFSRRVDQAVVAEIAARAAGLFPGLRAVRLLRAYVGFRPATPDRMPIIGPDGAVPGLVHATGHEGAGIGLSEATGELVAALVLGHATHVDPVPFAATRFAPGQ